MSAPDTQAAPLPHFVAQDPFIKEGLVAKYRILDWSDTMLK